MMFLHLSPFLAFAYFMWRRLRRYLHIFQQEGYDAPRFLKWVVTTAAFDRKLSLALIAYCIAVPLAQFTPAHVDVLLAFIFAGFGWWGKRSAQDRQEETRHDAARDAYFLRRFRAVPRHGRGHAYGGRRSTLDTGGSVRAAVDRTG